jgi:DNA helicase II / ATP-dependent DNA helicase PcrA
MILTEDLLTVLNSPQREAVTSKAAHLRILAGAGSGKTRVLVHRIAWLMLEQHVSAHRILAVTFTNKAAKEMRERIEKLMGPIAKELWVGTFHGLAHRILRQRHQEANLPENFQIIDSDDQKRLVGRIIKTQGFEQDDLDKQAVSFINRQKEEAKRYKNIGVVLPDQKLAAEIYRLYEDHCQRAGLVDFAELLFRVYELWLNKPDVLKYYQDRFSHVLVDEFQDTNFLQYQWLKLVCGNDNLTIVGDDDQSIYGWRGAKIENIHRFSQDYPAAETVRLEQNYRSSANILKAANALIENNETRLGKALWTEAEQGDKIKLYGAFNELDEANVIVDQVKDWQALGRDLQDVAILYRSNAQSRVLEQAFRQSNLPYRIYGGLRFFDRAEVKDVMAYLRMVLNKKDDPAFERIINVPTRGIGERTLTAIREQAQANEQSLYESAKLYLETLSAGRIASGLRSFFEIIETLQALLETDSLPVLAEKALAESGMWAFIQSKPGEKTQGRLENMQELVVAVQQFDDGIQANAADVGPETNTAVSGYTLPIFLSEVALDAGTEDGQGEKGGVSLMTLHSAKGLEFPMVVVAGMEEGLFPHRRSMYEPNLLEEERRLCYVGMTRAMEKLYLTYSQKRSFAGVHGHHKPSRFIAEIPPQLIEKIEFQSFFQPPPLKAAKVHKPSIFATDISMPFKIGQKVFHQRFGKGTVLGGDGSGEKARVHVDFVQGEPKWLALAYAKLESVD